MSMKARGPHPFGKTEGGLGPGGLSCHWETPLLHFYKSLTLVFLLGLSPAEPAPELQ